MGGRSWRSGIFLVHKPTGVSSHSLVRTAMEDLAASEQTLRVCHGGTLDPFAEGLLLLLFGQATRLMDILHALPKTYEATVAWGRETDSGDLHGATVSEGSSGMLNAETLDNVLQTFIGWHPQTPPVTSAKKIQGEPAYLRARRGETVVMQPVDAYLHHAEWLGHALPQTSQLRIVCRGGFYVRSLVRDLGRKLDAPAHVQSLRRTCIGPWADPGPGEKRRIHAQGVVPWCRARVLSSGDYKALKAGSAIDLESVSSPPWTPPEGYALLPQWVAGLLEDRVTFLLREEHAQLVPELYLPGGV